jgi:[glutamine synthetase] adenylyltransferase / [glutamine synthetase]-adenylyl-L-tyrosine phosphorylase
MKAQRQPTGSSALWTRAARQSADPERVCHYLTLLEETSAAAILKTASAEQARVIAAVLSGSRALGDFMVAHPESIEGLNSEALSYGRRKQGLQHQRDSWLKPMLATGEWPAALERLREFKAREMLRIAARDLAHSSNVLDIIREISDVADVCLEAVWRICWLQLEERYGKPYHRDLQGNWHPTTGCVLGMGKLGGQELNYSSDVDVLFVYADEGEVYPQAPSEPAMLTKARSGKPKPSPAAQRPTLANHQFFNRLAEAFIAAVTHLSPQGALFRIDLRLRPEGDSGPLSRSLAGYENYYAQWGQTWERMMLIKARGVAGDESLAAEFLETIQPFRYPRSVNESVLAEIGAMKDRIENEVVRPEEMERNVKLGRGGIREVEFIAQALQLLHAGRQPFLQSSQTVATLQKLVQYDLLSHQAARELTDAYSFLRDVEHRLQMENNQQTHTIPAERDAQRRLARLMRFDDEKAFETARRAHALTVGNAFKSVLKREVPSGATPSPFPTRFEGAEAQWKQWLSQVGFKDAERAYRTLREFAEGPGYIHVSSRTTELAFRLMPRLFGLCPEFGKSEARRSRVERSPRSEMRAGKKRIEDPVGASDASLLSSTGTGTSALGVSNRAASLPSQPPLSDPDRVLTRLDSFITAYGARATLFELWNSNPALFELLLLLFDRSEFLAELAIRTPDLVDELVTSGRLRQRKSSEETLRDLRHGLRDEDQRLWLRRYHQTEVMRIGLRDILGIADPEQYLTELSGLADACLNYALEAVLLRHKLKTPPFVIIGLGKLGGSEIDYGSDLDILFVADAKTRNLAKAKSVALEVLELLSTRTELGLVFHTDARLRPDGEKGLLVNTLTAYGEYYRRRAMLWEIQTLTRSRPIAGDMKLGEKFEALAGSLTNLAEPPLPLAAYAPDWKERICQMRQRIEKERTPAGQDELAIKTGKGGLMDAEFIAQSLCLAHGWHQANTLKVLERAQNEGTLPDAGKLIPEYRFLRRVEGILRRWSYEGEILLPTEPAAYHRVAIRCGFLSAEDFRVALRRSRQAIRRVYDLYFGSPKAGAQSKPG